VDAYIITAPNLPDGGLVERPSIAVKVFDAVDLVDTRCVSAGEAPRMHITNPVQMGLDGRDWDARLESNNVFSRDDLWVPLDHG